MPTILTDQTVDLVVEDNGTISGIVSPAGPKTVVSLGGGSGSVAVQRGIRQVVAGTQGQGQATNGYMTGYTRYESRKLLKALAPVVRPRIAIPAWYLLSGLAYVPNAMTAECGIEYAGAFYRGTFAGASTKIIPQNSPLVWTDPLDLIAPNGADLFAQLGITVAATTDRVPSGAAFVSGLGELAVYTNSATSQIGTVGGFGVNGGITAGKGFCPLMVVGETDSLTWVLAGDSIFNEQDLDTAPDAYGNVGFAAKGAFLAGMPFIKMNRTALRISQVRPSSAPAFYEPAAFVTDYISNFATNDINNGRTLAQIQADKTEEWARARAMGAKRVHQVLVIPSTNASNTDYLSANFAPGGLRDQVNAWFRAQLAAGVIDGIVDMNVVYESTTSPGLWVNSAYTSDGVHPNNLGAEAGKNTFRDYMLAVKAKFGG